VILVDALVEGPGRSGGLLGLPLAALTGLYSRADVFVSDAAYRAASDAG